MTREEIVKLMGIIALEFREFDLSESRVDLWHRLLGHHSFDAARVSVHRLILGSKYSPRAGDVNRAIVDTLTPAEERISPSRAWDMAKKAVAKVFNSGGTSRDFEQLPEAVRNAARGVGAWEIRNSVNPGALQVQFFKIYESELASAREARTYPPHLSALEFTERAALEEICK